MLRLSQFTKTLLWVTAFLLLTGCNEKSKTDDQTASTPVDTIGVKDLILTIDKTTLNKDDNTTVKVMVTYEDGTSKEVTEKVEWIVTPKDSVTVSEKILIAEKDNQSTLQAKLGSTLSNSMNLNITWVINGHNLPPEPDKAVNDSTLLGIDINNNGVRDDVERWIYEEYKDKHPIHIDIAMQAGRAYKLVLETPERAKEIRGVVNAPIHCNWYYKGYAKYFNEPLLMKYDITPSVRSRYYNTKERKDIYWQYDTLLSGGVYSLPDIETLKSYCDFNTSKYEE